MTMYYAKSASPITSVAPPDLIIWGPGDPRPTLPIAGWDPGTGGWPDPPPVLPPPLDFWGPNDPRPTVPIAEPPWGWGNPAPPAPIPDPPNFKVMNVWTEVTGWFVAIIPLGPTPTPSR
jgi:hypothetical protein